MNAQVIDLHSRGAPLTAAQLLEETHAFLLKYVAFPLPEQADATALWILHTHAFQAAETTPRLSIQSAEKQSGKTRLLEVLDLLVANPISTANISAAALFRLVAGDLEGLPTLLIDEVDTVFSKTGKGKEDLRGLLNAGYRRGSSVIRVTGGQAERFPVFAPAALAGIGRLPDTVEDRSIVIRLKRRKEGEEVSKLRRREVETPAVNLRAGLSAWGSVNVAALGRTIPSVPEELGDRAADIWEPLIAIAGMAGGPWLARACAAAVALSSPVASAETESTSAGVRLLASIRAFLLEHSVARVSSTTLVAALALAGPKQLATQLAAYGIAPRCVRSGDDVFRGYASADFEDAFARYL